MGTLADDPRTVERVVGVLRELAGEPGATVDDLLVVLPRAWRLAAAQGRRADEARTGLVELLTVPADDLGAIPEATVRQAQRAAQLRGELLASGAFPLAELARAKGQTVESLRTWLSRRRKEHRLFSVAYQRETWVPAFVLDDTLEARAELQPTLDALMSAGFDGWNLWSWLVAPSPWAGGERPIDLAPIRLLEVASRRAEAALG